MIDQHLFRCTNCGSHNLTIRDMLLIHSRRVHLLPCMCHNVARFAGRFITTFCGLYHRTGKFRSSRLEIGKSIFVEHYETTVEYVEIGCGRCFRMQEATWHVIVDREIIRPGFIQTFLSCSYCGNTIMYGKQNLQTFGINPQLSLLAGFETKGSKKP